MMNTRILVPIMALMLVPSVIVAQDSLESMRMVPSKTADAGLLRSLAAAVTPDTYRSVGFRTVDEVRDATLGTPVQEFFVRLDELREFDERKPITKLLHPTGNVHIPVLVDAATRSSIVARRSADQWEAVVFGRTSFIRAVADSRTELSGRSGVRTEDAALIVVPAFNLHFLGHESSNGLMLTPVVGDSRFDWKTGTSYSAVEVFEALRPLAQKHTGEPG
jgi:hypothetical protein